MSLSGMDAATTFNIDTMLHIQKQIVVLLTQLVNLLSQYAEKTASPPPEMRSAPSEPWYGEITFDEAQRRIVWKGGEYRFSYRKRYRFLFLKLLWENLEDYVTAEDVIRALPEKERQKWASIRRFGKRVQGEDIGPKNCPFYIRIETEGFTLMPLI